MGIKNGMKYRTMVVYQSRNKTGNVYMDSDKPYTTAERIEELCDYISAEYCDGDECIILNLIPLENWEEGDGS